MSLRDDLKRLASEVWAEFVLWRADREAKAEAERTSKHDALRATQQDRYRNFDLWI